MKYIRKLVGKVLVRPRSTLFKKMCQDQNIEVFDKQPDYHYVPRIYGKSSRKMRHLRDDTEFFPLAETVYWQHKRTCLYYDRLHTMYQVFRNLVANRPSDAPLYAMEIGVYKGGTSYYFSKLGEQYAPGRLNLFSIDTFEGHSALDLPEGEEGNQKPGHFSETSYESVRDYLAPFPKTTVIQNRIQDAIPQIPDVPFDLIHLDVDIYHPTLFTLEHYKNRLSPNAIIIVDDYSFTSCPGVKEAVEEFLRDNPGRFARFELQSGQCLLIRQT